MTSFELQVSFFSALLSVIAREESLVGPSMFSVFITFLEK
jgi:hypothetical protein